MTVMPSAKPWLANYDPGVPKTVDILNIPLFKLLEEAAQKFTNNTAMVFRGKKITFRELNELADAIAAGLAAHGFKKGDRAVIYMPNSPQFVMTYYGILKAGGIVIATNPLYTERELEHQLADCGAETVFVMSLFYDRLKKVQQGGHTKVKRIVVTNVKEYFPPHLKFLFTLLKEKKDGHRVTLREGDMAFQDFLALGKRSPKPNVTVTGDDIALLQYTGGTTGLSKGAICLHRNMATNMVMMESWMSNLEPGKEVILTAIPLFHSYGMVTAMNFAMRLGAMMVLIVNPRDLKDVLDSITKYKATLFPGVPAMYVAINNNADVKAGKYDLRSIKACLSGSAPLLQETKRDFEALTGGKLVEGFGMSETHVATHCNPLEGVNPPGSIGFPLPAVECRVVDQTDGHTDLGAGQVGELLVKGPTVMPGYWNMEAETGKSIVDGWLYTGDVVEMDEKGYFYIRDRKKDMIIAGGYNVYPREVEEVLVTHPAVMEAAVAGIPDAKRGETVKAWIVKNPGYESVTEQEIIEWSQGQLAKYKYPRMVEFLPELPRSAAMKVLKRELVKKELEKSK
jgi:long-chain acyl-CoA synthetase